MKKIILGISCILIIWICGTKWINPSWSYPWELFKATKDTKSTIAYSSYNDCWENFRIDFPYHIQTIGVTAENNDGSRVIIISEPPPEVSKEGVVGVFSHFKAEVEEKVNPIGVDGWVKDLVVVIAGGSWRQQQFAINQLYKYVYGSNYKPYFLNLSEKSAVDHEKLLDVNFSVSAAELDSWFLKENEDQWLVSPHDNEQQGNFKGLLNQDKYGVYYSQTPGFVIWVIPKGAINEFKEGARQFVLDSDVILGAIASQNNIAIIGRERQTNIFALPPLRVETIFQLAASDKNQISQSYERVNMFAGKLPGGKDWAPIYLSNDLINTEYGSLLNITDQMLKSWSEHGQISYQNFQYKKPGADTFPFPGPLSKQINSDAVTFNWNTKGAAYLVNYGDYEVAALNRTGSLPVTYIPEGVDEESDVYHTTRECEEKYYDFFSSFQDPNLIRVVQYAALYQMFSAFNVTAPGHENIAGFPEEDVPETYTKLLINKIQNNEIKDDRTLDMFINIKTYGDYFNYRLESYRYNKVKIALEKLQPELLKIHDLVGDDGISILINLIAHPRGDYFAKVEGLADKLNPQDTEVIQSFLLKNKEFLDDINAGIDILGLSRSAIKDKYVASYSDVSSEWIKTPSVVVSWSLDSVLSVGGHNIEAKMLGVLEDRSLAAGTVNVVEERGVKKLLIAHQDIDKVNRAMIREIELKGELGVQKLDTRLLNGTIRDRRVVFPHFPRSARGFKPEKAQIAKLVKDDILLSPRGNPLKLVTIRGEDFVTLPNSPNILYPRASVNSIEAINSAMKSRRIIDGELKIISFVEDQTTTGIFNNYCRNSFLRPDINSIADLATVFSKNPRKTFNLVGHIEDGAIYMPDKGVKLPLLEIERVAKENNVNYMIVGCESAFEKGSGSSGFVSKINSVDVAEALGMAVESPKNTYSFIHNLARNSDLRVVIYKVPIRDLGFATAQRNKRIAVISGTTFGIAAGSAIVIAIVSDDDDEKQG